MNADKKKFSHKGTAYEVQISSKTKSPEYTMDVDLAGKHTGRAVTSETKTYFIDKSSQPAGQALSVLVDKLHHFVKKVICDDESLPDKLPAGWSKNI